MTLDREYLLNKRYRIKDILGQGGMGAVYRAVDENLGVEVAVKENLFTTDEYTRQFTREATILASLRHPNLPRVSDHFEIQEQGQYLVMDYIEGEDLRQRMDRQGILPDEEVIIIGAGICDALQYLHTRKPIILHRDIKPGNVKINPEGQVYLVDFGLAKIVQGSQATTTGARAMTPGYSSPEQYGTARTDERSDIYSVGATLYAALTGAIPEDGLARAMEQADLTPIRKRAPKVNRRLSQAIEKALEIHPEDRYQSCEGFKQALLAASTSTKRLIEGGEITIPPPPPEVIEAIAKGRAPKGSSMERTSDIPGESKARRKRKKREKGKRRWGFLVSILIIAVIAGGAYLGSVLGLIPGSVFNPGGPGTDVAALEATVTETPLEELPTKPPTLAPVEIPTSTSQLGPTDTPLIPTSTPGSDPEATQDTLVAAGAGEKAIAFASDRSGSIQIWMYHLVDGRLEQITDVSRGACQPAFSRDGKRLAYVSPCVKDDRSYPESYVYVINLDDPQNPVRLDDIGAGAFDPAWSPVEEVILYSKFVNAVNNQIFRYNLVTGEIVKMTQDGTGVNISPAWSPDGTQIAFIGGGTRIYLMPNVPGAEAQAFSRSGAKENLYPAWSIDGDDVIFSQKPTDGSFVSNVYLLSISMLGETDTTKYSEVRISSKNEPEANPQYSSDGQWIVIESWPDGVNHDIFIMMADGSEKQAIASSPGLDFDPTWRP